ncbi:ATP-dependent RNA helicase-like protein [Striga asiatica]|uniref:ATP-dependent RNA helicase-like protein n=1 Tax=Striga asiatica TaxID=4170 RepID=A0A5A7P7S8_STRAF|nr:ATP-dependent RNA helicase-like protein [Striga asiatica]
MAARRPFSQTRNLLHVTPALLGSLVPYGLSDQRGRGKGLLVWPHKEEFLQVLKANQTLILVGEIGGYRRPDRLATQGLGATASEGAIGYDWCSWPDRQGAGEASIFRVERHG